MKFSEGLGGVLMVKLMTLLLSFTKGQSLSTAVLLLQQGHSAFSEFVSNPFGEVALRSTHCKAREAVEEEEWEEPEEEEASSLVHRIC